MLTPLVHTVSLHSNHVALAAPQPAPSTSHSLQVGAWVQQHSREQCSATWTGTETAEARAMAQNFWTLAFVLTLMKMRLDFFHDRMDRDETLGTQEQPPNLTVPQCPHTWASQNAFLEISWKNTISRATRYLEPFPEEGEVRGHVGQLQHEPQGGLTAGRWLLHRESHLQQEGREPSTWMAGFSVTQLFAITLEARVGDSEDLASVPWCLDGILNHLGPCSWPFAKTLTASKPVGLRDCPLPRKLALLPLTLLFEAFKTTWLNSFSQRVDLAEIGLLCKGNISSFHPRCLSL